MATRNDILDGIKTALETYSTAAKVTRAMETFEKCSSFPTYMVIGGAEEFDEMMLPQEYLLLQIKIRGFTRDYSNPEEALATAIEDVRNVLDSSNNPYHSDYYPFRIATDEGWFNLKRNGVGMFEFSFQIRYQRTRS